MFVGAILIIVKELDPSVTCFDCLEILVFRLKISSNSVRWAEVGLFADLNPGMALIVVGIWGAVVIVAGVSGVEGVVGSG